MSVESQPRSRTGYADQQPAEIALQAPPALPRGSGSGTSQLLFMLPMMLGMGAMSFVYIGRSGGVMTFVFGALFVVVMVGMVVMTLSRGGAAKKAQINDERRDYLRYLAGLRGTIRQVAARQRAGLLRALPDPADLWQFAGTARMFQRRAGDGDFGRVRVALGPQRLGTALRPPQTAPLEDLDPVASTSLRHFIRAHATVADLPVAVSLRAFARVTISGDPATGRDLTRAMLAQLATFSAPDDLRIAVCAAGQRRGHWEWVKWLPHAGHPTDRDASGPLRLYAADLESLGDLLADDLAGRPPFRPGGPSTGGGLALTGGGAGGSAFNAGGTALGGAGGAALGGAGGTAFGGSALGAGSALGGGATGKGTGAGPGGGRPHLVVVIDGPAADPVGTAGRSAGSAHGSSENSTDGRAGSRVDERVRAALAGGTGLAGVTVIEIGDRPGPAGPTELRLVAEQGRLGIRKAGGTTLVGAVDRLDPASAEAMARRLTAYHVPAPHRDAPALGALGLVDLLGVGDPRALDPAVSWRPRPARDRLRIPIGLDPQGQPLELDLKESAEGGMGPHGLVIGATGSGKSELLRTLVTGLAVTHSSETLNFALIDFKGGATFAGMTALPHTCAVITNLAAELSLVDRMGDALRGELVRRQELLRSAGNYASVRDYERARQAGANLDPIPSLLVIIDEFSELLSSRPEFVDLFVMIGRLGRSLAVHLLLASQRLEEGRLRGLDSHLSYRVGLRTFSASESRAVLGVPDAYELPAEPGGGYLRTDTSTLLRFKAAYVSGAMPAERGGNPATPGTLRSYPVIFGLGPAAGGPAADLVARPAAIPPPDAAPRPDADAEAASVMETLLGRLDGHGPPAYQIWLPPLAEPPALDQILPPLTVSARGLGPDGWAGNGQLTVPVAIVDKPFEQRRDLLWADLSGAAGNAVVVGAPQSGKTTLLRTLAAALAVTHTPREVQFFVLDLAGGGCAALAGLPHTSGYATRLDAERCRRIVAELTGLLADREELFQRLGLDSAAAFRRDRPAGPDGRPFGDVFLIIDGWLTLRQEFEALEEAVNTLAARGLGFGIHVILSVNRWMEVRPALRDTLGTQFELRLGDPADSAIDRRAASGVPAGEPGRGITEEKLHFLTALPRLDGVGRADDLAGGVTDLVSRVAAAWPGEPAPPVRLLPRLVPAADLPAAEPGGTAIPIGIAEHDLKPVRVDFAADPHLIAFGDTESGKTNLLRLLARGIQDRYSPAGAAILVVDYRRGLLDVVGGDHLLGYAGSEPSLTAVMPEIAQGMRARLPGPDVTAEQLRRRSWWSGPEMFVLVDDYDLVATQGGNPLLPLVELLPQARDIGLHLIVARRSGGAGRALYEPVVQRLRELGSPGLVLSGSRDEGALVADVKPSVRPPGQGQFVSRRTGAAVVQVAWTPPPQE
ncbi:type VII secretion protein EccCa [Solwaraspora sp. WMMD1047]|uniref:type VII secretion protein EccCa n=1 Tax=Solwaraspora sp. WMMD1047 TaxID=3016102 RepID=UPI0024178181|nr:type VII secretion protein EccCa [Solwaraspora sp. WMMD1047]MDG4829501.1 type VII secretion protein EccCa [Solwaraspora sp. WMMD1047]